jgi:nucleoside 2-deoxyribosyltransferase
VKIYVAGASRAWKESRKVMEAIRKAGHTITYDWTTDVEELGTNSVDDPDRTIKIVDADVKGVRTADTIVILTLHQSIGKWIEFGIAIALSKPVIFLGKDQPDTIFRMHYTVIGFARDLKQLLPMLRVYK